MALMQSAYAANAIAGDGINPETVDIVEEFVV